MDGNGVSGGVSDELPLADPELPQLWSAMGPTENDVALLQQFAPFFDRHRLVRSRLQLGGRNTGHRNILFFEGSTRDDGDEGGHPRHGDADAGADDDEEEFGFSFGAVPASGVAMACLPETTVGGPGDGEAWENGECAVCLEEYEAGDALRTMPCAHGFHERCIFGWLRASRLCPLCRFALPPEEVTEDDEKARQRLVNDESARQRQCIGGDEEYLPYTENFMQM